MDTMGASIMSWDPLTCSETKCKCYERIHLAYVGDRGVCV